MKLAVTYAFLALVATIANIGSQHAVIEVYSGPLAILTSVIVGTGVGLVVKYVLDKRYIFAFRARDVAHDGQTFILYSVMGLVTTAIFWGFEFTAHFIFGTDAMRYLGGAVGLAIGYIAKYHLDKRYVFRVGPA